jgi:acylphosphatase
VADVRFDIIFTGRVQGVGFRATTVSVAQGFQITGWVRNEPNGSVRCVAEGDREELGRFVEAVKNAMEGYVRDARISQSPGTGEFRGFHVRH